jgi:hypothetical protein
MGKKSNLQKITKLSYAFILACLSYYFLVGSIHKNNSIPDLIKDVLLKKLTKEWYQKCPNNMNRYRYNSCEPRRYTAVELGMRIIYVENHSYQDLLDIEEWNKHRRPDEFIWVYKDDEYGVSMSRKYKSLTKQIIWIIFLLTLPIIWFSRGLSIPILNSITSAINKGWNKI